MLFYTLLVITLTISSDLVEAKKSKFKTTWRDCGSDDAIVRFRNIGLEDVVRIGKTTPVKVSLNATQSAEVPADSQVNIKIKKILNIFGNKLPVVVPCINGIGSCEASLCEIFKIHKKLVCTILEAAGHDCNCPSAPGVYNAADINYQLPFTLIPTAILSLGNGDYTLDMEITHNNKQIACLAMTVVVKFV